MNENRERANADMAAAGEAGRYRAQTPGLIATA